MEFNGILNIAPKVLKYDALLCDEKFGVALCGRLGEKLRMLCIGGDFDEQIFDFVEDTIFETLGYAIIKL